MVDNLSSFISCSSDGTIDDDDADAMVVIGLEDTTDGINRLKHNKLNKTQTNTGI